MTGGTWWRAGVIAVLASGCDLLFQLDHVDVKDGGGSDDADTSIDASVCLDPRLHDPFDDQVACLPWGSKYESNQATAIESGGVLTITPFPVADSVAGCQPVVANNVLFGSGVTAIVTEVAIGASAYSVLLVEPANVQILSDGTFIVFQSRSGENFAPGIAYKTSLVQWRIRPMGNEIVGEVSSDGTVWTQLGVAPIVPPAMIGIHLAAGTNSAPVMGRAMFEDLKICP